MSKSPLLFSAAIIAVSIAQQANAQAVEEIVVTAQKRTENLQDVPIAVSAITANAAVSAGVRTSEDLRILAPGLDVQRQTGAADIYIRGIGTAGGQAGQENAVAVFFDGVYQPSMNGVLLSLSNIERVEVLKGPQGTLYGRNATGGAVNIITKDPTHEPSMNMEFGFGNLETVDANAYVTGGLSENVAADLSFYYHNQGEGFGRNVVTGNDVNKVRDTAIRSKILFTPTEDTRITLGGYYVKSEGSFGIAIRPGPASTPINGQVGFPFGFFDVQSDVDPHFYQKLWGAHLRVEQDFGAVRLTSITGYGDVKHHEHGDLDLTSIPFVEFPLFSRSETFTQEFQLANGAGSDVQWIVGAYYMWNKSQYTDFHLFGSGIGVIVAPGFTDLRFNPDVQTTKSYALYGQTTFPILETTNLTLGARYTIDKRRFNAQILGTTGGVDVPLGPPINERRTFKKPSWRIALDHNFTDDIMAYASYSRGFKSGVFNTSAPADPPVEPETLDAYEVGLKTTLFDKRLRFNVAGFRYDYKNIQLQKVNGASTTLLNAAKARIYGIEADFDAVLFEGFTVRGGAQYLDHKYREFAGVPLTQPVLGGGNIIVTCPDPSGVAPPSADFCSGAGNKMIRTPDWVFSASANYEMKIGDGDKLAFNVSYAYNDGFFWEPGNRVRQGAYEVVNSQIQWTNSDESLSIRLWARNLLNEKYFTHEAEQALGDLAAAAPGRLYGVSVGTKF